jgi:O-antigen/teichoic acid export membrane protein
MPVSVISAKYAQIASEYYFKSMKREARKIFYNSTFACLGIASSLIAFLFIVAKYVYFYVNQEFNLQLFIIVSFSMLIFSIYGFWISFLIMINKGKTTSILLATAVFCNLLFNSIITPERGYFGSAISDLLCHLIALLMSTYFLIKFSIIEYK